MKTVDGTMAASFLDVASGEGLVAPAELRGDGFVANGVLAGVGFVAVGGLE